MSLTGDCYDLVSRVKLVQLVDLRNRVISPLLGGYLLRRNDTAIRGVNRTVSACLANKRYESLLMELVRKRLDSLCPHCFSLL